MGFQLKQKLSYMCVWGKGVDDMLSHMEVLLKRKGNRKYTFMISSAVIFGLNLWSLKDLDCLYRETK